MYLDDLVLRFVEVCGRKVLKVDADKSEEMVLVREEGMECEVCVDGARLNLVSGFKYLGLCFGRNRRRWCMVS